MFIRTVARWMLASWFIATGLDAARRPAPHVAAAGPLARQFAQVTSLNVDDALIKHAVRAQGFAMAGAAGLLATGIAPRLAATALAALTLPAAVVNAPLVRSQGGKTAPAAGDESNPPPQRSQFLTCLAMTGAAALAAFDRQGKPSLAWRATHPRRESVAS